MQYLKAYFLTATSHQFHSLSHQLALELYTTGYADAMYLADLIAENEKMTSAHL
ncbi:hypothetical protein FLA_2178 [Filimonas lacunae]|nr:hypothetical protein FLA_2178 [Filimonas lacunae]